MSDAVKNRLYDYLDSNISWRKREITVLFLKISSSKDSYEKNYLIRSFILILYSHFEGFIKESTTEYLKFISCLNLTNSELKPVFKALSLYKDIKRCSDENSTKTHVDLLNLINTKECEISHIPYKKIIDTKSNLKSKILKEIIYKVDFDYDDFWITKELLIDGKLLFYRNKIAHGERITVEEEHFNNLHSFVIAALDKIKEQIEFATDNMFFLKSD